MKNQTSQPNENTYSHRRNFVKNGFVITLGISLLSACKEKEEGEGQEVSQPEDLMQEQKSLAYL